MTEENEIIIRCTRKRWRWSVDHHACRVNVVNSGYDEYDTAEEALAAALEAERKYEEKCWLDDEASDAAGLEAATA